MKPFLKLIGQLFLLSLLWSCNNLGNNSSSAWTDQKGLPENEVYTIDELGISIAWTAYKFTDRVGVSGTFNDYTINKKNVSGSIEHILNRLQLSIPTESIETKNAIRDFKIKTYFFEAFNTPSITGTVINVKEGEGDIRLKMNKTSHNATYTYSLENDTIVLFTRLDLKKWKGEEALAILDKECVLHLQGVDGISKVWPDVDVVIKLPVNRTAN